MSDPPPKGRACHDTAAITGQFAMADRELVILRLARLSCLFARTTGAGRYRGSRGDRHLMARLAPLGIRSPLLDAVTHAGTGFDAKNVLGGLGAKPA